jgi:hypothetical protein
VAGRGRQRFARAWSMWGWVCPFVSLWFPLWIIADIENTDLPTNPLVRLHAKRLRGVWWTCWLLAWVTGVDYRQTTTTLPGGGIAEQSYVVTIFGGTIPSAVLGAAAGILFAVIVLRISSRQEIARTGGL